jgi:predicted  nucleic acid-binding Zn-ribbon protein
MQAIWDWLASWFRAVTPPPAITAEWKELVDSLQKRLDDADERLGRADERLERADDRQGKADVASLKYRQWMTRRLREADEREAGCREMLAEANAKIAGLEEKVSGLEGEVSRLRALIGEGDRP